MVYINDYLLMSIFVVLKKTDCFDSVAVNDLLGGLVRLLGQKDSLDVGEDSTLGDGDSGQELVQLLVIPDGKLEVTGDDPGLLVVTGSVTGQLEDLSGEVLHDGGQIDGGTSTNTGGVVSLAEETVNTSNGELETSTAGPGLGLSLNLSTFTTSGHVESLRVDFQLMPSVRGRGLYPLSRLMSPEPPGRQNCEKLNGQIQFSRAFDLE